jgi:predicted AAA+ superfamily ATPase
MSIHPVLREKLNLGQTPLRQTLTFRDARLAPVKGKVHAVVGMRRAGKTTFLRQLQSQALAASSRARAIYLSFDDDRLADLPLTQLDALVEEYYREHPRSRGQETVCWYLDEIQLVTGWERFVRRLIDTEKVEVVVSGSSARMLSREIYTSLRGRGWETVIRPFSFREYLRHRHLEPTQAPARLLPAERSLLEKEFKGFLAEGGFPEAQGLGPALREPLLQGYVDTVLLRDVMERYGVGQVTALRWVARHCLRNPSGSMSVHALFKDLKAQGLAVSKDTVHALVGHLYDAFLIAGVPVATESERQRNSNSQKIYPADMGLIGAFDRSGKSNVGHALETAVFNELQRRQADVSYVRTPEGSEVDFLTRFPGGEQALIQVCAEFADEATWDREVRALSQARKLYPKAKLTLLTMDYLEASRRSLGSISIIPAWFWMLNE